jgi:hypothetical protein
VSVYVSCVCAAACALACIRAFWCLRVRVFVVCVCVCVLAYESSGNAQKRGSSVDCQEDLG